ncbi:MAG TPA: curli-like amyloid fiber formation chaperone CsgH [Rubricoccaceae bacterium]
MTLSSLLLAAAVAGGCVAVAPDSSPRSSGGEARIQIDRGDVFLVRALFDGTSTDSLSYRLEVLRDGAAGRSQSAQGGAFESAPGRTDTLSTVRINTAPGDRFEARLVVSRGAEIVSESVVQEAVQ